MIPFVEPKKCDRDSLAKHLATAETSGQWSNYGKLNDLLESMLEKRFGKRVHFCCSGTAALWSAMLFWEIRIGRRLKWAMSSFTFPCVPKSFFNVDFIDCDDSGMMDLRLVRDHEGLVVTNLFGGFDTGTYVEFSKSKSMAIVVDGAMNFDTHDHQEFEMISFHHTKPWGFGEGGCILIPECKEILRGISNFGRSAIIGDFRQKSMNAKLSEIAAAGILQHLEGFDQKSKKYSEQYQRIKAISEKLGYRAIGTHDAGIPCFLPLAHEKKLKSIENDHVVLKKYYEPITNLPRSASLYERCVCFPCHSLLENLEDKDVYKVLLRICQG